MNVDFTQEQPVLSNEICQGVPSSMLGIPGVNPSSVSFEPIQPEANSSLPDESAGDLTENERLVMPKRPHNVISFIIFP